jgi:hypothetical protein
MPRGCYCPLGSFGVKEATEGEGLFLTTAPNEDSTGVDYRISGHETFPFRYLKQVLRHVRAAVEKDGELTDAALQETHYGGKANSLTKRLAELRSVPVAGADELDEAALKAKRRDQILTAIDRMLEQYDWQQQRCSDREEAEESAREAASVLPSSEVLDRILRYETALERQLYRAMNQLERLQRRRMGEVVPPPISMEMSH